MPKPITIRVMVDEAEAFAAMRKIQRTVPGVVAVEFDFAAAMGGPGGARNGAGRPPSARRLAPGQPLNLILRTLADGKPHPRAEVVASSKMPTKRFQNVKHTAKRDGLLREPGPGLMQITAKGSDWLKAVRK